MKTPYLTIFGQTATIMLFAILFPIVVLYSIDRTIASEDYAAGIPLKGCIFKSNCVESSYQ